MATLSWLPDALDDLKRLHEFTAQHNADAANRAVDTLIKAANTLASFPEQGRPWEPDLDYRELSVRFGARGYVIRYRIFESNVVIVRIWHGKEHR